MVIVKENNTLETMTESQRHQEKIKEKCLKKGRVL